MILITTEYINLQNQICDLTQTLIDNDFSVFDYEKAKKNLFDKILECKKIKSNLKNVVLIKPEETE